MRMLRRVAVGVEVGAVAGAAVAAFFFVEDAIHLRPLSTPVVLAAGLMGPAASGPASALVQRGVALGAMGIELLAYTVLHVLTFAAVGVSAAFALRLSSFWKSLLGVVVYGSVVCTGLLYGTQWIVGSPVALHDLGLPSVLLANAMAGAIMGVGLQLARSD